jgi:hypothetical protein
LNYKMESTLRRVTIDQISQDRRHGSIFNFCKLLVVSSVIKKLLSIISFIAKTRFITYRFEIATFILVLV